MLWIRHSFINRTRGGTHEGVVKDVPGQPLRILIRGPPTLLTMWEGSLKRGLRAKCLPMPYSFLIQFFIMNNELLRSSHYFATHCTVRNITL